MLTPRLPQSYGTVLGQYFAAIYPDKVGRMVIDGVYDGNNYRAALWNSNLLDNEAVINSLFTFCHQAGPQGCVLYESTPSAIRDRFFGVVDALKQNPVPIPLAEPAAVLTYKDFVNQILTAVYSPTILYPILATAVHAIETSNQTTLAALAPILTDSATCDCAASQAAPADNSYDAFFPVACGDADPQTFDRAAFQAFFDDLVRTAPTVGPIWATLHLGCTQWPVRPNSRYTGPLAAQNTSTAHPLLVLSPKFDPVCPLRDALAVRGRYAGAGLLVQNSNGHCTLSVPSVCTAKVVRTYFEEGTLPVEGTVCEPDELPFVGRVAGVEARSEEDERLLDAARGLSRAMAMFKSKTARP